MRNRRQLVSGTAIVRVHAWEALDSRGRPTVATRIDLAGINFALNLPAAGAKGQLQYHA